MNLYFNSLNGHQCQLDITFESVTSSSNYAAVAINSDGNNQASRCLILSALRDNYDRQGVIGALHTDLGIDVKQLASSVGIEEKAESLKEFNCWVTQIPIQTTYRHLIVYEPVRGTDVPVDIFNVFRFVSLKLEICIESVTCVLLATNSFKTDKLKVFRSIVEHYLLCAYFGVPIRKFHLSLFGSIDREAEFRQEFVRIRNAFLSFPSSTLDNELPYLLVFDSSSRNYIADKENLSQAIQNSRVCEIIEDMNSNRLRVVPLLKPSLKIFIYNRREFYHSYAAKLVSFLAVILQKSRNGSYCILSYDSASEKLPYDMLRNYYQNVHQESLTDATSLNYTRQLMRSQNNNGDNLQEMENAISVPQSTLNGNPVMEQTYTNAEKLNYVRGLSYLNRQEQRMTEICIIYNVSNKKDFHLAAEIKDLLTRNNSFVVFRREFNPKGNTYTTLDEVKQTFSAIQCSHIIFVLVNHDFIQNFVCRFEYKLAQSCYASHRYPATLVPIITDDSMAAYSINQNSPGTGLSSSSDQYIDPVFLLNPMLKLVSDSSDVKYLSTDLIDELSRRGFTRNENLLAMRLRGLNNKLNSFTDDLNYDPNRGTNRNQSTAIKRVIISCDESDRDLANKIAETVANEVGSVICAAEHGRASISEELNDIADNVAILYLLSPKFLQNANCTVDTIYELFKVTTLGECVPRVRCVLTDPTGYSNRIPMFILRQPTLIRKETDTEDSFIQSIRYWIFDDTQSCNPSTLLEPKSNFDNKIPPQMIQVLETCCSDLD